MKSLLPFILLFAGSFLAVGLVMGGLLMFRPELFGMGGGTPPPAVQAASSTKPVRFYGPPLVELRGVDSLVLARAHAAALQDTLTSMRAELARTQQRQDSLLAIVNAGPVAPPAIDSSMMRGTDRTTQRKAMTKLISSMQAENVVPLLKDMSDEEVKDLLLTLKTKQAAKILAALGPDRAAKLIR